MPQIGWLEILIVVIIAILIIGPKDFPIMIKKIGMWVGSFKNYFSEVQKEITDVENTFKEEIPIEKDLKTSTDNKNRRLKVIELEMSYKRLIPDDDEPSSYINFYIANKGVVMPSFDDEKADKNAQKIVQETFPDRKINVINGINISMGGGNVHCITQQQPLSM